MTGATDPRPAQALLPVPAAGRPILVTGLPRTGTSWVGKMLQASGEVVYVNEPLNPQHPPGQSPGVLRARVDHRFQYICPDNEHRWTGPFRDTLRLAYHPLAELRRNHRPYDLARMAKYGTAFTVGRLRGQRALLDDPFAVLSSAWFAQRLGCHVVICLRQPASFVGSWQRLGWQVPVADLLRQPLLMRDLLGSYERQLRDAADSADSLARTATLWSVTYAALADLPARVPGVYLVRYEDLASRPGDGFRELYQKCGLTWTTHARKRVLRATTGGPGTDASHAWTLRGGLSRTAYRPMNSRASLSTYRDRLTPAEIDRVHSLTAEVAARFYDAGTLP